MLTGQVFLVTLVAGLVSLWRRAQGRRRRVRGRMRSEPSAEPDGPDARARTGGLG